MSVHTSVWKLKHDKNRIIVQIHPFRLEYYIIQRGNCSSFVNSLLCKKKISFKEIDKYFAEISYITNLLWFLPIRSIVTTLSSFAANIINLSILFEDNGLKDDRCRGDFILGFSSIVTFILGFSSIVISFSRYSAMIRIFNLRILGI